MIISKCSNFLDFLKFQLDLSESILVHNNAVISKILTLFTSTYYVTGLRDVSVRKDFPVLHLY